MTNLLLRESWTFDMRTDLLYYSMLCTSLSLYLLIMLTRQIKSQSVCSRESVEMVKQIAAKLNNVENDCMMYTPTQANYKQNCSKSTITCFAFEVSVLSVEIQVESLAFRQLQRILNRVTKRLQDEMEMKCPVCELYKEESTKTFLNTLQHILEQMNAERICAP
ncbi:interleukin 15, like isoform X1 [Danio rerio]|uniref:Interleukin n=1 Tax=Danio rerio TaxID=7955 RepID=A0A0R4IKC3_DANRE|nr:interleukin 15, like isoform X1 [Danio rerio]|eukprot:XP_005157574.1 interleukin 15, like isoform X1 [Danio rerio]